METKKFTVKKKIKKAEKQGKKARGAASRKAAKVASPPKIEFKIEPKATQKREQRVIVTRGMKSECPSERYMPGREVSFIQTDLEQKELSQLSVFYVDNPRDRQLSVVEQSNPVWDLDNLNDPEEMLVVPHSHPTGNRGRTSQEVTEEEGAVSIFQEEFRKVSRLDSPKMSISSSIKGRSLHNYRFFDQLPIPQSQNDVFMKMKNFLNPPQRQSNGLNFVQTLPAMDHQRLPPIPLLEETEKSNGSEMFRFLSNKSSSRRSRKNSRKNSSVENLNV